MSSWITPTPPIWTVRLPRDYSSEEFNRQFDELTRLLRLQRGRIAIVIDVSLLRRSQSGNRERAAEFFRQEKPLLKEKVAAWSFVTNNTALRGAIAAIGFMGVLPIPTKTFDTLHAAEKWLRAQLQKRST